MSFLTHSERKLFDLLSSKHEDGFIQRFDSGEFVNHLKCNSYGESYLAVAIKHRCYDAAEFLMDFHPDLIHFRGENDTPIAHYFSRHLDPEYFIRFVSKGMDPDAIDHQKSNLLHKLASFGNKEDYLKGLSIGLDNNKQNNKNETPNDTAIRYRKFNEPNLS
ncbi:hypothetical protein AB6D11_03100 [Vibrio splendidus]